MKLFSFILFISITITITNATSLRDSTEDALNKNAKIISEYLKIKGYEKYIDIEKSDYHPTLDFEYFIEDSHTDNKPKTSPDNDGGKEGWNGVLKFEHILYDGGLTPAELGEYKHEYLSTKYESTYKIQETILDLVKAYNDLVSRQEMLGLSENNIQEHKDNLKLALEKEEISGEVLESFQVQSKLHFVLDRFLEQENDKKVSMSLYKELTTKELTGNICRPLVYKHHIPSTIEEAVEVGIRRSYKVKEQIDVIQKQKEILEQKRATFRPNVKLQLQAQSDYDIAVPEDGYENIYRARIFLDWNLYEGGKNSHEIQQEKIFLIQEQKNLDAIIMEKTNKIKEAYETYYSLENRITNLKLFVNDNTQILKIYQKQLDDGTRTFLDILNAASELYRSQIQMIELEFDYINSFYELMFELSMLSDVILLEQNQICPKYVFVKEEDEEEVNELYLGLEKELLEIFKNESQNLLEETTDINLDELEGELGLDDEPTQDAPSVPQEEVSIEDQLSDLYLNE